MAETNRAVVQNAGDPKQVKRASRRDRDRARVYFEHVRAVMATPDGRFVMWALLGKAGVYRSVFDLSSNAMAYNAGRQDFGHELLADVLNADTALYLLMEQEARERERRDNAETDAAHTQRADEKEHSDA